jgi:hypothetical protein
MHPTRQRTEQKVGMLKNWARFTCFWLIFILIFSCVNKALRVPNKSWYDFYHLPPHSIDVLFMGNSHSLETFQPSIINDILPINSYSIGIGGENIYFTYYELREILKTQKPKVIYLETFTLDLTDMLYPAYLFGFTDSGSLNLNKLAVAARFLPFDELFTIFPALRTQIDWNTPKNIFTLFINQFQTNKNEIDPNLGFISNPLIISDQEYSAIDQLPDPPMDTSLANNRVYLEKFIDLCKNNDIKLVFVTSPILKISGDQFIFYNLLDKAPYMNINQISQANIDFENPYQLFFSDYSHVSTFGSLLVSIKTAQVLARMLSLPIDQDKLAYYQAFQFSSFTLTHKGNEYNLKLIPEEKDSNLLYRYKVFINDTGQEIYSSEWVTSNDYRFHLIPVGRYYWYNLEVEIKNPEGDYSIKGRFKIDLDRDKNVD